MLSRVSLDLCHGVRVANLLPLERSRSIGIAELHATGLRGSECCLGVLGDGAAYGLSYRSDDVNCEPVRIGHVSGHKVYAALLET